ncbi:DNA or RNA helicase of superfamily II [Mycobacterium kansasii]|uniref:DEAD/DEAH box helicase family protein n=1 Tax=Mycobacterium kansasii TaxID=1768 RepID=UPI000CDD7D1A|nr:DEAD/DEAH box helicase family protein [Mycobacterium kansasii]POX89317.1 DNA or RNA helicase of superfamily II [Mycobacterium kansasii]POX97360.1 DNA or RNA helicase of superfamily II [Mycobacterium kansasii]POY20854.1 DNA or RNA helicase of superfamily II [Mycobacterium kansasii]POY32778.1 DNA or RNA helicase of superfamily II [Mycobacterium kansasii]
MEPGRDLHSRAFAGEWRRYQQQALDAFDADVARGDNRSYLVLPPGAGKTMIGLEAARRVGRRTLVLVPNTAVQAQWAAAWDTRFSPPDPSAPGCGTDRALTAAMNVLTYQSLAVIDGETDATVRRAILRTRDRQALLGLLHPNGRALIERAASLGPWTLVLDECHHLLATWGALVGALLSVLGPRTALIGLTATPATALTEWQRALHDELFGTADFVVPTPALVKEGGLAPYQELVYLTGPTPEEQAWMATERARFADLMLALVDQQVGSLSLAAWLRTRIVDRSTRDGNQIAWSTFERAEPALAASGLRFAFDGLIPLPDGARLREQHRVTPDAHDWVTVLTDFAVGHLQDSGDPRDAQALTAIKRVLPGLGYRLTSRGVRVATSPVDRVCALSESKVAATTHILDAEDTALGARLRALVLCDFESMTGALPTSLKGAPVNDLSGSAQLVTAMLAASDTRRGTPLRPLLVTGQTFACPAAIEDDLIAFCAARGALVRTEALQAHPGLRIVRGIGNFGPRIWVTLATEYFMTGRARVLVGTRALLGEGWDCAAVNVTVDLTSATTPGAITQMRGRALRRDPADADKVADNWSVCCISPDHPRGDADYLRLVRKHDAYFAASPQGLIESGVTHCDPRLSPYGPPPDDAGVTARALQRVAERGRARAWWRIGEPYQGTDVATIRIRSQRSPGIAAPGIPASALVPSLPGRRSPLRAARAAAAGVSLAGAAGGAAFAGTSLGPLAGATTAGAVIATSAGVLVVAAGAESRRLAHAPNALEQLAAAVGDALRAAGGADRGSDALRITVDPDGWIRCELGGVPTEQSQRFTAALDELLAPLTEPRYLIGRKILTPPTGRVARGLFAARAVIGVPLPGAVAWHGVPQWFARRKDRLECLLQSWRQHIGPPRHLRADSPEGQAILELFRGDNPLALTTQLRTTWR